jgi:hypothetical protein
MQLTKSEIEIADRYISKREKQLAQWPSVRWLMVAICLMSMLIGYRMVSDGTRSIHDDRGTDLDVSRSLGEGPPPGQERRWTVGAMMKMGKILETRYQVVTYALMEDAVGYIQFLAGAIIAGIIIMRWNTSERDALICKLLRGKLQEFEQDTAPDGGPPAHKHS